MSLTPNELLGLIEEGLSMVGEVPPAGASFATSVGKKLRGIRETVARTERVSPAQESAVTNMIGGLQKWLEPPTKH